MRRVAPPRRKNSFALAAREACARACRLAADQPAKWTRPRWRRGDWRRVTKCDPVRTVVIRARASARRIASHAWKRGATRDGRRVDVATRRRGVPALRRTAQWRRPDCRVHAPRSWRRARALPFHLHNAAAGDARATCFSRDEDRWRRLDAKKYINRVNICRVNSSRVSHNDPYQRDKHDGSSEREREREDMIESAGRQLCR